MMRKFFKLITFSIVLAALALPSSLMAEQGKFYFGPAMGYNMDAFNAQMEDDNAYGFNFVLGYDFTDHLTLEAQFDKINEIGVKNPVSYDGEADLQGYSLNVKYYPAKAKTNINGYLTFGLGWMEAETAGNCSDIKKGSGTEEDLWGKFGVGSDFVVSDKISFFLEADYAQGYKDLNPIDFFTAKIGFKIYP
ncbi:MAG: outer membrane beta-barrel protein [Desulforegulaceae bacterium]|nr:outer membrane beta-barrel protein [Desulforegulaceae bacterium]